MVGERKIRGTRVRIGSTKGCEREKMMKGRGGEGREGGEREDSKSRKSLGDRFKSLVRVVINSLLRITKF